MVSLLDWCSKTKRGTEWRRNVLLILSPVFMIRNVLLISSLVSTVGAQTKITSLAKERLKEEELQIEHTSARGVRQNNCPGLRVEAGAIVAQAVEGPNQSCCSSRARPGE